MQRGEGVGWGVRYADCLPHLPPFMSMLLMCRDVCSSGVVLLPSCMQADRMLLLLWVCYCCWLSGHAQESVLLLLLLLPLHCQRGVKGGIWT